MRIATALILAALLAVPTVGTAEPHFNVNVNLGVPVPPPPPHPAAVVAPRVVFNAPPLFLAPSALGFYVGVDMPYDVVLVSGVYYLFQGNHWYRANHYNGPWVVTRYEHLPAPIKRYKVEKIRYYRDREYRVYHDRRDHYRGRHFRPERVEMRHERDDRREHHEDRQQHRRDDRREHHEDRQQHKQGHGPRGDRD